MKLQQTKDQIQRTWKWLKLRFIFIALVAVMLTLGPLASRGQIGLDPCCAIISAGLNTISALLQNVVAKPLAQIQQIQAQASNFEQQVIYPAGAINNARGLASQMQGQMLQMSQLYRIPVNSATLAAPQQLEQALLSHNAQALGQVGHNYTAVYGAVMAAADAPQPLRDLVDMTDAEAQAAFKKAVELDAIADVEQAAADQINRQIQSAAPGSAPILEAQASAWLVRANAYTQSAIAELMRVRSVDLANSGAQLKFSATDVNTLRNNTKQVLQKGAQ
jgi:hypothetical protein